MRLLQKLRSNAMKGNWSKVFKTYKQESALRASKITGTGDTVLHMAVSSGKESVVANMIDLLVREENDRAQDSVVVTVDGGGEQSRNLNIILRAENDRKNTPLHFAAKLGHVEICKKISDIDPSLIARRNIAGETPLFLSALNGWKNAFLWLHYRYMKNLGASSSNFAHCMRDNEDSILHCTIAAGHIDVAIEIIHLCKDHVKEMVRRNKEGLSPLHILASKRFCFKSSGLLRLPRLLRPIYCLWKVKEKTQATTFEELQKGLLKAKEKNQATTLARVLMAKVENIIYKTLNIRLPRIRRKKEMHTWTLQIMNELLQHASDKDMSQIISRNTSEHLSISLPTTQEDNETESGTVTIDTPLMIAAKNDVVEMVEKILELFPSRVKDVNAEGKNILLLAADYRGVEVFRFLCKQKWLSDNLFEQVDKEGNNALHLAAKLRIELDWLVPGESLFMLMEMKWFQFVGCSMPRGFWERHNRKMEIPMRTFKERHKELVKTEGEWVAKASQACCVVSTLVVSVAFATRISVPGGYDENSKGYAILRDNAVFKTFEGSSLAALFLSLISTICLLSVVVSPFQSFESWVRTPYTLYFGVSFMLASIVCLWISFCAADFFILDDHTQKLHKSLPTYTVLSSMIILLVVRLIPTFLGPTLSTICQTVAPSRRFSYPINYQKTKTKESSSKDLVNHQN